MSRPAAAIDEKHASENGGRSILKTVVEQNDSVESDTDDLFEKAATGGQAAFRSAFESNVSSLKGFNNSLKDMVKGR